MKAEQNILVLNGVGGELAVIRVRLLCTQMSTRAVMPCLIVDSGLKASGTRRLSPRGSRLMSLPMRCISIHHNHFMQKSKFR